MDTIVEDPVHGEDEGKLNRIFMGGIQTFPGNASVTQYFQNGLHHGDNKWINPSRIALVDEENSYTFGQLDEFSSKLAEAIRQVLQDQPENSNPDRDIVIGVCIPPSDKLVQVLFAIMKLGAAYLPFDVSFPEDRVVKIVKNSAPIMIICDHHANVMSKFETVTEITRVVSTADLLKAAQELEMSEDEVKKVQVLASTGLVPEKTAIVLYTSGSSGEPKGVRLSNRCVMNRLHWQWQAFPFVENEQCLLKTSLTFVDSVAEIFGPLLRGYPLTIIPKTAVANPNIFIQKLEQYQITRLVLVPSLLRAIFQLIRLVGADAKAELQTVKLWVCSGEALKKDLVHEFFEHFPNGHTLCNFYGSTEVMGDVTYVSYASRQQVFERSLETQIPIGLPIFNTVIYILDDKMEMVEANKTGEIYVGGYNLAKGYVGLENDARFVPNPFSRTQGFDILYKTGDFGRITNTQGKVRTIVYEGRVDSQLKVRGQRVDLAEIELTMSNIYLIAKVVVLCYHPGQQDQAIVAFVVPNSDAHVDRIKAMANSNLRDYERPVIKVIDEIPLLVNGKTDRQRLLKQYEQDLQNRSMSVDWDTIDLPKDKIEIAKMVFPVMAEVVGTDAETIAENLNNSYFNVGGSSLNSIHCIVKMREKNCFITVPKFVGAKSIKEIILASQQFVGVDAEEDENVGLAVSDTADEVYDVAYLVPADLDEAAHMIAYSFSRHGDLEKYTHSQYEDFQTMIKSIWGPLVEKGLSFIVRRKEDQKAIGVSLSFDVYDEPEDLECNPGIQYVLEMLEFLESRQREKLPKGKGKLVHSFMMGTLQELDESENVFIIQFMEERVIKMAKEKGFIGVMTTNTNPLTQQIALEIHGYEVLSEYSVNKYVAADGTKPFVLAPDSFKIMCSWKSLGHHVLNPENIFFHAEKKEDEEEEEEEENDDLDDDDDDV